ncbi:hypothetical protein [Brevundimonas lenta]|uniref:Lipoprotein n=1 Tax=Brevundimonas lenta TaxID=424796 RepID=A0A7W6JED2_9CAUL|nr:hypothetical protein [Brevundimonas lenta]MBB4083559.1 hypothetical protein [Brevundimonas lenta]
MNHRFVAIAVSALALSACAGPKTIPLDASHLAVQERALVPVTQEAPIFMPMRASRAGFGMVGALAMIKEGETYAVENGIVDPSAELEARIQARMQEKFGARLGQRLDFTGAPAGTPYPVDAGSLYVDAKVYGWGYSYFPTDWTHFRVNYGVMIHLVDGAAGTVIGQYNCNKYSHTDSKTAPTLDQLLENNSALMNSTLKSMAEACAAEFDAQVLGTVAA